MIYSVNNYYKYLQILELLLVFCQMVKKRLKKTLFEKEKLLIMSNFSCARNYIFCQISEKVERNIVGKVEIIIAISDK